MKKARILIVDDDMVIQRSNRKYRELWQTPSEVLEANPTIVGIMEWEREQGIIDVPDDEWQAYIDERLDLARLVFRLPRRHLLSHARLHAT